jgi:hypothetical protein
MQRPRRTRVTRLAAFAGVLVLLAFDAAPLAAALWPRSDAAHACPLPLPCCAAGVCPRGGHHHGAGGPRWSPCGVDADAIATAPVHLPATLAPVSRLEPPCGGRATAAAASAPASMLARPPLVPPPR